MAMLLSMFTPNYFIACFIALTVATQWQYAFEASAPIPRALEAWSGTSAISVATAQRSYLGPFGNDSVRLHVRGIPRHDTLIIDVTVYILGSWDGVVDDDRFVITLDAGDTLLCSTFSNTAYQQNFPSARGGERFSRRTGASDTDVTGWLFVEPKIFNGPLDAEYLLSYKVPHSKDTVNLNFIGTLKDVRPIPANEAWGIGSVRIRSGMRVFHPTNEDAVIVPGR